MTPIEVKAWLDLLLGFAAVVAVVVGFVRWGNRSLESKILNEIRESTRDMQPKNGGHGWTDLHRKVDRLVENQVEIKRDVDLLKSAVVQLENDAEGIR